MVTVGGSIRYDSGTWLRAEEAAINRDGVGGVFHDKGRIKGGFKPGTGTGPAETTMKSTITGGEFGANVAATTIHEKTNKGILPRLKPEKFSKGSVFEFHVETLSFHSRISGIEFG